MNRKEYFKNYNKKYYLEHKEVILKNQKKYCIDNKEKISERHKTYYQKLKVYKEKYEKLQEQHNKAIEIIKLCDTKCAKELLEILGDKGEI